MSQLRFVSLGSLAGLAVLDWRSGAMDRDSDPTGPCDGASSSMACTAPSNDGDGLDRVYDSPRDETWPPPNTSRIELEL